MSGRPRTACSICKAQKIRCTGEKPVCKRCARLKNKCTYDNIEVGPRIVRELRQESHSSYLGIPRSLVLQLIELYYENVSNASLLLHKASLHEAVDTGIAIPHVLLSICAFGANFYRDGHASASLKTQGFMTEWAQRAGKLAFQEIEEFSKDLIVTFLNLTLFWYSQGSWRISSLYKANAFHSLCTHGIANVQQQQESPWEAELQRRRFWAWYIMHCHNTESLAILAPLRDLQVLPLPCPEEDFASGVLHGAATTLASTSSSTSIFAEMIKILTFWSRAVQLIQSPQTSLTSERVAEIHALDEKTLPVNDLPRVLLTNLVYHQTLCVLHASIVPLFCWSPGDEGWSSARLFSAQVAYEHACSVSALIDATISSYPRLSAMPTFVAYAAYGGCAILIPFMWCSNPLVRRQAQKDVETNIRMIHLMAEYWKFASLLTIHVRCLYSIHKKNPPALEDEPKYIDVHKLTEFRIEALYARVSILQFLGILQKGESSFVEPGEETTDLGINHNERDSDFPTSGTVTNDLLVPNSTWQNTNRKASENPWSSHVQRDLPNLMQAQQWNLIPPNNQGVNVHPPAPDVSLAGSPAAYETIDFGHYEFSLGDLDIDGWNLDLSSMT